MKPSQMTNSFSGYQTKLGEQKQAKTAWYYSNTWLLLLDAEILELLREPLLGLLDGLLELRGLGTSTLATGLLATSLTANDGADGRSPLLGGDTLG